MTFIHILLALVAALGVFDEPTGFTCREGNLVELKGGSPASIYETNAKVCQP